MSTFHTHDRFSDALMTFSHRLAQIKFIILEIVIFIGFLLWLYDKVKHDFNINFSPTSAHAQETHDPCHVTLPVFRSD
jgi:predicted tellurium resistance membrane protein TerC